jgi:DNA repair protein RadC
MTDCLPELSAPRSGPRERILQLGEPRLSDAEVVALLLRTGQRGEPAEAMAQRLLRQFGGLRGLASAAVREVAGVAGVGLTRAAALAAAFGLARRLQEQAFLPGAQIRHGGDVARWVLEVVRGSRRECFHTVLLDTRHRVLSLQLTSLGTVNAATVHPREVFSPAVREAASAVVVAHNHPSGDPTPSVEDRLVTDRLREVGDLVGIPLLDHLVIGAERYYSFAEEAYFHYAAPA